MRDYSHFYRQELPSHCQSECRWDILISAYNDSERVLRVFDLIRAEEKHWIVHKEYGYEKVDVGIHDGFFSTLCREDEFVLSFCDSRLNGIDISAARICVDATGFMRPHLMFFLRWFQQIGGRRIDIIYSEPSYYRKKDATRFSDKQVQEIRQVVGFEGLSGGRSSRDVLIIGAGYETHLIEEIAEDKDHAQKLVLLGLPSLSADMYQQNAWHVRRGVDALGPAADRKYFAPASDPFATASVLSDLVYRECDARRDAHLYLAPLSTKAQTIGFALYYLTERLGTCTSIIFPFSDHYDRQTSVGLSRIWLHTLEF